jgi:succinate dehydrogenase/fumarate reductase flavoprotein subunit
MSEKKQKGAGLSRRDFLKTAAAGAVGAATVSALGACASAPAGGGPLGGPGGSPLDLEAYLTQKWAFELPPAPITSWDREETAEIVVVGAGMAGLTTAYSAVEKGAQVIVIAASSKPVSRGGSNSATNSRIMQKYGVDPMPLEFYKREMFSASYRIDQQKWSKFYNRSEEAMNWLVDLVEAKGVTVTLERDNADDLGVVVAHGFTTDPTDTTAMVSAGQQGVVEALDQYLKTAGVPIYYKTRALQLVRGSDNKNGRVTAVIAEDMSSGQRVKYNGTKAIVLGTGDFSADRDMIAKYCPWVLPTTVDRQDKPIDYDIGMSFDGTGLYAGDGHKMGLWIGAAWQKVWPAAPILQGPISHTSSYQPLGFHQGLVLNAKGERYFNEDVSAPYYSIIQTTSHVSQPSYAVWTANYAQAVINTGRNWYTFGQDYTLPPATAAAKVAEWDAAVDSPYAGVFKAASLDELAGKLGIPADALKASVARYNELCRKGQDTDFFKKPELMVPVTEAGPFYGANDGFMRIIFMAMTGGLRTDKNMQVCDTEDNPIPGLFNVGIMVGDMYANQYNFAIPGNCYGGNCLTFGYVLGRDLAANAIPGN